MENNELNNLENKQLHGEVLATKVERANYQKTESENAPSPAFTKYTPSSVGVEEGAKAGNKRYQLIEKMLVHQITKYIGGYAAAMGGIDAVVFTGGIGENNPHYRARIAENLRFMGADIDEERNNKCKRKDCEEMDLSTDKATLRILCIPTNEELMIARDTLEIVNGLK